MITFTVDLTQGNAIGMEKNILSEFLKHITSAMTGVIPVLPKRIEQVVVTALRTSPTVGSITNGELADILCLSHSDAAIYEIERAIVQSINIVERIPSISGNRIAGGFTVEILEDSFTDIISINQGSYTTLNGKFIPWLEWLLFYGTSPVLLKGKLIKTQRGVIAARHTEDLNIPAAHAGDQNDNFITRAIRPLEPVIGKIIEQEMARRI